MEPPFSLKIYILSFIIEIIYPYWKAVVIFDKDSSVFISSSSENIITFNNIVVKWLSHIVTPFWWIIKIFPSDNVKL